MTYVVSAPAVLLEGRDLVAVHVLVQRGLRALRDRDGVTPAPAVLQLVDQLGRAAAAAGRSPMSANGHASADMPPHAPSSERVGNGMAAAADVLTASEVAASLSLSPRHVTRLAAELGGVKHGRSWRFSRTAVEAFSAVRAA